jgi:alkylation response protein AidB-like acyl-CoA dehydrogenase
MIDFEPSEEQALIRDTVHQFAENEIRPKARECDEAAKLDANVLALAHELGLVANSLPEQHGGGGELSAVTGCLIAEELAWGDLSLALGVLSPSLLGLPLALYGTAEQQASLLPGLVGASPGAGSIAWVEPRFDFDAYRPQTTARRDGAGFVLDGIKCFVPWQEGLDHVCVVASEQGELAAFLVPQKMRRQKLQRHRAVKLRILGLVDDTHPAFAELLGDAVVRDGLADHVGPILPRKDR